MQCVGCAELVRQQVARSEALRPSSEKRRPSRTLRAAYGHWARKADPCETALRNRLEDAQARARRWIGIESAVGFRADMLVVPGLK
jgi:hypothetical protein